MKILAAVFQGMPFLMAILVGMLVPILVVISGLLAEKWKDSSKVATILGILILGNAVSVLLSGRVLYSQEEMALNPLLALDLEQGRGVWAGRITNATILFVSLGEIFRWVTKRRKMPETAVPLLLAFLAFYIASYWVGVFFATAREIQLSWLYAPIAFTALALISKDGLNKEALTKLEWVLVLILGASLAGAILVPGMTLEPGYKSWVPGFSSRLYGFAEHANSLGIIAALARCPISYFFLLRLWHSFSRNQRRHGWRRSSEYSWFVLKTSELISGLNLRGSSRSCSLPSPALLWQQL
jgi:hypothetical protein